ncbi:MAG TPA: putative Ig domain-containing protein, partial [Vulgatibacter sp.]
HGQGWATSVATSPSYDLGSFAHPLLRFRALVDTEACCDGFNLSVSEDGGTTFTLHASVDPAYGSTNDGQQGWTGAHAASGWRTFFADLSDYAGGMVNLRFAFRSDGGVNGEGILVDDLTFVEAASNPLAIPTLGLPDAFDGVPYLADVQRTGGSRHAVWSIAGGTNHGWLSIDPATGRLTGQPTSADRGRVSVTVRVEEPSRSTNFAEATLGFDVIVPVPGVFVDEDFTSCSRGWVFNAPWECGSPSNVGPAACHDGAGCVGTNLSGNYPNGVSFAAGTLDSPTIDLTNAVEPKLWFWAWVQTESCCDGFHVKASSDGGQSWTQLTTVTPAFTGNVDSQPSWGGNLSALGWRRYSVDLSSLAGSTARLRFAFRSDGSSNGPGVYVDDVFVAETFANPLAITTGGRLPDAYVGKTYSMRLSRSGGSTDAVWTIVGGPAWLAIDPATGILSGSPESADVGTASVTVRVQEPQNTGNSTDTTFTLEVRSLPAGELFADTLDVCTAGWDLGGDWACGAASGTGPGSCRSGSCLATNLTGDYSNGQAFATATADSPWIDLADASHPRLVFWAWVKTASSDGFHVKVTTDGTNYTQLTGFTPDTTGTVDSQLAWTGDLSTFGWRRFHADLLPYVGDSIRLRFAFRSDGSGTAPGVYVDDLQVIEAAFDPLTITTPADLGDAISGLPFAARLAKSLGSNDAVWTLVSGPSWLQLDPDGLLHGTPSAADAGRVTVSVHVEEPMNPSNSQDKQLGLRVIDGSAGWYHASTFEACSGAWDLTGVWECGMPAPQVGPGACRSGGGCLATRLAANYDNGVAFGTASATSPTIDLTGAVDPMATFWAWVHTEPNWDGFNAKVSVDGGNTFQPVAGVSPAYPGNVDGQPSWSGNLGGWRQFQIPLADFVGGPIVLRLDFRSDGSSNYAGVYVDDLRVIEGFADPVAISNVGLPNGIVGLPWTAALVKSGGGSGASWSVVSGPAWISLDPTTGVLSGMPSVEAVDTLVIRLEEPGHPANFDEKTFTLRSLPAPTAPYYVADFSAAGGWAVAGEWERGTPTSGPGSCRTGGPCLATKLGGNYAGNAAFATSVATSPTIDLTTAARSTVHFWAWLQSE